MNQKRPTTPPLPVVLHFDTNLCPGMEMLAAINESSQVSVKAKTEIKSCEKIIVTSDSLESRLLPLICIILNGVL